MSAYDYLTGNVVDPRDNVGKVRKFGHKGQGLLNPNNPNIPKSSIGDLIAQDNIYAQPLVGQPAGPVAHTIAPVTITPYQTPGPVSSVKASEPLVLPPILRGSVSNVNLPQ